MPKYLCREVVQKLRTENTKLRKELKSISDDLTMLLEKQKKKNEKVQPVREIASNVNVSGILILVLTVILTEF